MHKKLVANIVSRILLMISVFLLFPLGWAVFDQGIPREIVAFLLTILIVLCVVLVLKWLCPARKKDFDHLNAKDGLAVVGLSWLIISLFGALPFYLSSSTASFTDAFFETASGFTTTGASIMTNVEILPRGILLWRSLIQWLGGMGVVVLSVALLPAFHRGSFQFYKAEAPGPTAERLQPKIKETAKVLWSVYLFLSLAEIALLKIGGMSLFESMCHTFTTMATGGFSTRNASIAAFSPYIHWVITVFMFMAGTNFLLHYYALSGNPFKYFRNEEFRTYFFLVLISIVFFFTVMLQMTPVEASLRDCAFQVVSILTTTGYSTVDFDQWPHVLRLSLLAMMFIGGCAASTGGGVKVIRLLIAFKTAFRSIFQSIFPNAVIPIKIDSIPVSNQLITSVLSFIFIYCGLLVFGTMFLTISDKCPLITAFSASIASLSNIGPGLGKVGPSLNFAWISSSGKWMLSFFMIAGRLELYSLLILFIPTAWRK